jgi:hypothetical protein
MLRAKLKGQSTLEYVILLGFVVAALIAMGIYMKRGSQGQLRRATDQVGEQYEAGETLGKYTEKTDISENDVNNAGHITTRVDNDIRTRNGFETVADLPAVGNATP